MTEIACVVDGKNTLGEGPHWHHAAGRLIWVDIIGTKVCRLDPATGDVETWDCPKRVSAAVPWTDDRLLIALEDGIASLDLTSGAVEPLADIEADVVGTRLNDAKCDRAGRFWVGSMDEAEESTKGDLYRVDADLSVHRMDVPVTVSNSLCWSPDDAVLYVSDSPARTIYRHAFDAASGTIGPRQVFARTEGDGFPDGSTVDAEGYLWNAEWDGWRITRYAPDGSVDRHIGLPVQRPTCLAFGGADLRTLYLTSARTDLSEEDLASQPQAGGVFALDVGVAGLPEPTFGAS